MSLVRHLFFTDPHFTDREQDAYRWKIFPFLRKVEDQYGAIDDLWCLGDLTEFKDHHSSRLLHRIVKELETAPGLSKHVVKGNHDYIDEGEPFFDWLGELDWGGYGIRYYSEPEFASYEQGILVLPHTNNPVEEWKEYREQDEKIQLVLTHITVDGCQSEMGQVLPGISRTQIPGSRALILSGDIHKPQHLGPDFIYVGTPYSTRYSPHYHPRVLLLEWDDETTFNPKVTSIYTGLKRKIALVTSLDDLLKNEDDPVWGAVGDVTPEDEIRVSVKVGAHLSPSQWKEFKEEVLKSCKDVNISLVPLVDKQVKLDEPSKQGVGLNTRPEDALSEYCKATTVPDPLQAVGSELLRHRLSKT